MIAPEFLSDAFEDNFFPFSLTRSVADIRCGILTLREKWNYLLQEEKAFYPLLKVPGNLIPDFTLIHSLRSDNRESALESASRLVYLTDILRFNATEIKKDFELITKGRASEPIPTSNKLMGENIFIESGAVVEHCYLNATEGPIYIGKDALVMEGSMIRGPFAIGEKTVVKMGSKIYGATTAGPHCVLGGEIKNSIFFGFSNKGHDGYLGDSVIGEWCNLGGGSSGSNLKNSFGNVRLWNPLTKTFTDAGLKCGLMMGDYSRSAINTSFTTGAVVGVCCHVFGNGPTPAYLPSFSWGYQDIYSLDKAIEHIGKWKKLKNRELTPEEAEQLKNIFDQQNKLK